MLNEVKPIENTDFEALFDIINARNLTFLPQKPCRWRRLIYIRKTSQIKISDDFFLPFGGTVNRNNRWVKLAELIPWSDFEDAYAQNFKSPTRGEEALSVRVALGTLIIQTKLKLVDAEVLLQIMENPYLQYFLGFDRFEIIDKRLMHH